MIGIYGITNLTNGKIYIGKSINILRRFGDHKRSSSNPILKHDLIKFGIESFSFDVLEECDIDHLEDREKFYITKFKSHISDIGYNLSMGGDGFNPSSQAIERLSEQRKGERNPFYGRRHTTNAIQQIKISTSQRNKGKRLSESTKNKISLSLKNHFEKNGYSKSAIKKKKEYLKKNENPNMKFQYTLISPSDKQIVFKNMSLFCQNNSLSLASISQLCSQKIKCGKHKGWIFVSKERIK